VTPTALLEALRGLLLDPERRAAMSERAKSLAKPGAVQKIAAKVVGLAKEGAVKVNSR
jgi:UDP-N-acetylglucosamine:LPS N-acetylglucosamine transferase